VEVDTLFKQLLFTTVHIRLHAPEVGSGTGFLYNASRGGENIPVLVTNKHVVMGTSDGGIQLMSAEAGGTKPRLGHPVEVRYQGFEGLWVGHPSPDVDVAAMFLGPTLNQLEAAGQSAFIRMIDPGVCPTATQMKDLDAVETVTFVGYPNGLYDIANHTPITRQGTTASPIHLDWGGTPCFLIDASVFPGSSGSPVFLVQRGQWKDKDSYVLAGGIRTFFLGVVAAVMVQADTGTIVVANQSPLVQFKQMIDLGIVYKWTAVEETVEALCAKHKVDRGSAVEVTTQTVQMPEPTDIEEVDP
jgi:V8-like Glu-specific endopeptidase